MDTKTFIQESPVFKRLASMDYCEALTPEQRNAYDADLQVYRDLTNQLAYAKEQGEAKEKIETIIRLHSHGAEMRIMKIATGLTEPEIEAIIAAKA